MRESKKGNILNYYYLCNYIFQNLIKKIKSLIIKNDSYVSLKLPIKYL